MTNTDPIDGEVLLLASAKASVGPRLPELVERAQEYLKARTDDLQARNEVVYESEERIVFLIEEGFWESVGERLEFDRREVDAVRRAHAEQLLHFGRREDRTSEFETALEIREPVVVGV